jgi:hypothetical protein
MKTLALEQTRDLQAVPVGFIRASNDRNGSWITEYPADLIVRWVHERTHALPQASPPHFVSLIVAD